MFCSSSSPVVCRKAHVKYVNLCLFGVLCFCFAVLRIVCPILSGSLDCPFLLPNSVGILKDLLVYKSLAGADPGGRTWRAPLKLEKI